MEHVDANQYHRLWTIVKLKPENVQAKLLEFLKTTKPKRSRTSQQNRALHKDCDLIAEKLNDAGYDMRHVIKKEIEIPWTTESVKKYIYKPILKAMFDMNSTTEIEKHGDQLNKLHEVIMRELGQKFGIEYHPFPFDPEKLKELEEMTGSVKHTTAYPSNDLGESPF